MAKEAYTGELLESEMFGEFEKKGPKPNYWDFKVGLNHVKNMQPEDPHYPKAWFAQDLFVDLLARFDIDEDKLAFYTAIHSNLDWHHKIDGFFEMEYDGKMYRVTIDLTKNPNKEQGDKVDMVLLVNEEDIDKTYQEERYDLFLNDCASRIEKIFRDKIKYKEVI